MQRMAARNIDTTIKTRNRQTKLRLLKVRLRYPPSPTKSTSLATLGLALSTPPQQVISAVMINQDPQHSARVPLKAVQQHEMTKALACNVKDATTIECLQKQNKTQKTTISLQKTEVKALVEDRR